MGADLKIIDGALLPCAPGNAHTYGLRVVDGAPPSCQWFETYEQASDPFIDDNDDPLSGDWSGLSTTFPKTNLEIQSNMAAITAAWLRAGVYHKLPSNWCQALIKGVASGHRNMYSLKHPIVRCYANERGYEASFAGTSGDTIERIDISKSGTYLSSRTLSSSFSCTTDHTVAIEAIGTGSSVTIRVYCDGTQVGADLTDSSSPLGEAYAGLIWADEMDTVANSYIDDWYNYEHVGATPQTVTGDFGVSSSVGFDATITAAVTVIAEFGVSSSQGFDATASTATPQSVTGDFGLSSSVGFDATIATAVAVVAEFGQSSSVGFDASISAAVTVTADFGVSSSAGFDASIATAVTVVAQFGLSSSQGFDATAETETPGVVVAEFGQSSSVGFDATISAAVTVTTEFGSSSSQGFDATILTEGSVTAEFGQSSSVGFDAQVTTAVVVVADFGQSASIGFDASIATTVVVVAEFGQSSSVGFTAFVNAVAPEEIYVVNSRVALQRVGCSRASDKYVGSSASHRQRVGNSMF